MEQTYQVISTGSFCLGQDSRSVKQNLITAFKMPEEQATVLSSGRSIILKKNIDSAVAEKYRLALEKAGLVCRVVASVSGSAVPARAANPSAGQQDSALLCPKCGYQSPSQELFRECPGCGIIISKYQKQTAQPSAQSPKPSAPVASGSAPPAPAVAPVSKLGVPAKRVVPPGTKTGIELTARFFPLNLMLYLCVPKIDIDGEIQKAKWGKANFYPLLPGEYTIRVFVPYPDKPKYAMVEKLVTVDEKKPCCFDYFLFSWTSQPGRLTVNGIRAVSKAVKAQKNDSDDSLLAALTRFFSSSLSSIFDEIFMPRLAAALCDTALFCFLFVAVQIGTSMVTGTSMNVVSRNLYVHGAIQCVALIYFVAFESSAWQATIGKKIFALRVTNYDGDRISVFNAIVRHLARLIFIPATLCVGFLMIAFTERKQGLHDLVSKCLVSK